MAPTANQPDRLAFLDVARGIAALAVVLSHGLSISLPGFTHWVPAHFDPGRFGVLLFFLISGFIIPVTLERGGSNARFWMNRFFRLFPLYWFSIALAFLYCRLGGVYEVQTQTAGAGTWLLNLTMTQGFFGAPHVWGVFWTLHVELLLYVFFACWFALGQQRWLARFALVAMAVFTSNGLLRALLVEKPFFIYGYALLYLTPLGGVLFQRLGQTRRRGWVNAAAACFCVGPLLVWSVNTWRLPSLHLPEKEAGHAVTWCAAVAVFWILSRQPGRRWPSALRWLGQVSYSVYLLHPLVLALLEPTGWPVWLFVPCLVGGTLAVSAVTYYALETPAIRLGRRLWAYQPRSGWKLTESRCARAS